jgi:LPXTG-site transpeptidase (sortase) family protein
MVFHKRALLVSLAAVLALVALGTAAGGLFYWWSGRGNDHDRQAHPTGPDVGGTADDSIVGEDFLRVIEQALRIEQMKEEQRRAAEAYAVARAADEALAADLIKRWGGGQLLLALPTIDVSATVSALGFERDGSTPAIPYTPWGVGWYEFTDYPGTPGNAVFSGHVDWYTGAPAVFARLRDVAVGDLVYLILPDATPVVYQVERTEWVDPDTADVAEIFGITDREAVTFITCGGTWNAATHDYSHRLIVRAFRVR